MNSIIRQHYPASKLPDDLRTGIGADARVTVTISVEDQRPEQILSLEDILARRRPPFLSADEIDAVIAAQRDEWA